MTHYHHLYGFTQLLSPYMQLDDYKWYISRNSKFWVPEMASGYTWQQHVGGIDLMFIEHNIISIWMQHDKMLSQNWSCMIFIHLHLHDCVFWMIYKYAK